MPKAPSSVNVAGGIRAWHAHSEAGGLIIGCTSAYERPPGSRALHLITGTTVAPRFSDAASPAFPPRVPMAHVA